MNPALLPSGALGVRADGFPLLYCLPSSGGSASMFRGWRERFAESFDIRVYQPPGRETRFNEPPHDSIGAMAAELLAAIEEQTDAEFTFFGHSLGALLAFETVRLARRTGRRGPTRLIVSACAAPHRFDAERLLRAARSDAASVELLRELGGTPPEVLSHPEMLELILPPMRADLAMLARYHYLDEPPLDLPLLILGGRQDPLVQREHLAAWAEQTTGDSQIVMLEGGHFYWAQDERFFAVLAGNLPGVVRPR